MSSKFKVQSSKFGVFRSSILVFPKNEDRKQKTGNQTGYTLFELVITLTVLSILIVGVVPLAQNAVKRQKELRLRETLRDIREAIDEFRRDTIGACPPGSLTTTNPTQGRLPQQFQPGINVGADPRSRVVIDDCTIFNTENLDRYPPSLEILVEGVKVRQRGLNIRSGAGLGGDDTNATDINQEKEIIKVYLREMPIDPMTGESDWQLRSSYQTKDDGSWDSINVFDVRSSSEAEALNGDKYSDW